MRTIWVGAVVLALGCAGAPVQPAPSIDADLARADARLLQGCYRCLIDARDDYARLASGPFRAVVVPRLFDAELLIAMRLKELAMDGAEPIEAARALLPELPPELSGAHVLSLVEDVAEDALGAPSVEAMAFRGAHLELARRLSDELAWIAQSPLRPFLRDYLSAALICSYDAGEIGPVPSIADMPQDEPMLSTFRVATCDGPRDRIRLEVVLDVVPEFAEASYFLARIWLGQALELGPGRGLAAIAPAETAFPDSPAVVYVSGTLRQIGGDYARALADFDRVIALRPAHEKARLGRVVCLAMLERFEEAMAEATTLIDMNADNRREAYYWRAWIRHRLKDLPGARADITRAKQIGINDEILLLAGIIEYEQDDLDPALSDFEGAWRLSMASECRAADYRGMVHAAHSAWNLSAAAFDAAMGCYERNGVAARQKLAQVLANSEIDPAFKAAQIVKLQTAVEDSRRQYHVAAINAGKGYANSGDRVRAARLGDIAAEDPSLAEDVGVLRDYLRQTDPAQNAAPAP